MVLLAFGVVLPAESMEIVSANHFIAGHLNTEAYQFQDDCL